jgi:hypothetical protein
MIMRNTSPSIVGTWKEVGSLSAKKNKPAEKD